MGHVIQTPKIERHIITKQGEIEVTINLNLTITLDQQGGVKVTASAGESKKPVLQEEKVEKVIPDFGATKDLLDFGKIV
jgi:acyl-CoA hydrolase